MSCSAASNEAFSDADRIETIAISPRPIISADDVAAVRRGLRIAFSRPSRAAMLKPRTGRPIAPESGRAARGDRIAIPMKITAAPPPISSPALSGSPNSP